MTRQQRAKARLGVQQRAKNYINPQAKERMLDLGRVSAESWRNSIYVEGYEVLYYGVTDAGYDCTCRANQIPRFDADPQVPDSGIPSIPSFNSTVGHGKPAMDGETFIVTSLEDPFGWHGVDSSKIPEPLEEHIPLTNGDTDQSYVGALDLIEELFEDGVPCGICQRRGIQPGLSLHGHERLVLSSLNLTDDSLVQILNQQPDLIEIDTGGFAEWEITIPKYWTSVRFQMANNLEPINSKLEDAQGNTVDRHWLDQRRGQTVRVRTTVQRLTHVTLEFQIEERNLKVSFPQLNQMKDYRKFIAIPVVTIVVPNLQRICRHSDIIVCPHLNQMWKVSEVQPLELMDRYQIGWSLQARIVQPNEGFNTLLTGKLS